MLLRWLPYRRRWHLCDRESRHGTTCRRDRWAPQGSAGALLSLRALQRLPSSRDCDWYRECCRGWAPWGAARKLLPLCATADCGRG